MDAELWRVAVIATVLAWIAGCQIETRVDGWKDSPPPFDSGSGLDSVTEELCNGLDDDGDGAVDEGFEDADNNGRVDCRDVACPALELSAQGPVEQTPGCTYVSDPWALEVKWRFSVAGQGTVTLPVVGHLTDDNGDGARDELDTPEIIFSFVGEGHDSAIMAIRGDGTPLFRATGTMGWGGVAVGDVDSDGVPEVIGLAEGDDVVALDAGGAVVWTTSGVPLWGQGQPALADLDGDGSVEVVYDQAVLRGADGEYLIDLSVDENPRAPVVADLDRDGDQEIILGDTVLNRTGGVLWRSDVLDFGAFSAVLDVDGDAEGEVLFVSESTAAIHDANGTLLSEFGIPGVGIPGPPAIADFDGDGEPEIAFGRGTQLTVFEVDGTQLWSTGVDNEDGNAGCSGFDLDGDGAAEVLYADFSAFHVYDGRAGLVRFEDPTHTAFWGFQYPVVADLDLDGSPEIVVANSAVDDTGRRGITVYFGGGSTGWAQSGTSWQVHDFATTNVAEDGSVPAAPLASWTEYNLFRARPVLYVPQAADLAVAITDVCAADCTYGPAAVALQVWNQGAVDVPAGIAVQLYTDGEFGRQLVAEVVLPAIAAGTTLAGIEVAVDVAEIDTYGFIAVVDDPNTINECEDSNNEARWVETLCP